MNNLLPQEEKLYKGAEQFLEYCLSVDSADLGVREFYNELAAAKGMESKDIASEISKLQNKVNKLKDTFSRLKRVRRQIGAIWLFDLSDGEERFNGFVDFCNEQSNVKLLENYFECGKKLYKVTADIAEDFWDYLIPEAKEKLQDIAYSMLMARTEELEGWGYTLAKYLKDFEVIRCHHLYKTSKLVAKCDDEILRFIGAVLNAIGEGDPDEGLYHPEVMKQFLDLLVEDANSNPSKLVPYTEEMSKKARSLISGVEVDE